MAGNPAKDWWQSDIIDQGFGSWAISDPDFQPQERQLGESFANALQAVLASILIEEANPPGDRKWWEAALLMISADRRATMFANTLERIYNDPPIGGIAKVMDIVGNHVLENADSDQAARRIALNLLDSAIADRLSILATDAFDRVVKKAKRETKTTLRESLISQAMDEAQESTVYTLAERWGFRAEVEAEILKARTVAAQEGEELEAADTNAAP